MRRLNRDEYANTVRDLLKLDELIVRPLTEELPGDGKAEGFDRLGVALFFDQTQIERSLSVAEQIAARTIVTEPPKTKKIVDTFGFLRKRPPEAMIEVSPDLRTRFRAERKIALSSRSSSRSCRATQPIAKNTPVGEACSISVLPGSLLKMVIIACASRRQVDKRGRKEKDKFRLQYAIDSPIQAETEVVIDSSGTTEAVMFLQGPVNGEVKGPQVFRVLWNHTEQAVINEPSYKKLVSRWTQLRGQMEQAAAKRVPQAEMDALKKKRGELEKEMNAWTGVAYITNPALDIEKLPRLQIESIEIEGPIQKEWPPPSHKAIFFAGDQRQDAAYVEEILARFLPRAYRRPVTKNEVAAIVSVVKDAQATGKQSFAEAMRTGLQARLVRPGFLFLGEPLPGVPMLGKSADAAQKPRPLTDYELASRLSYFLWSTMPDEELFTLAAAGKLREPAAVAGQVRRMLVDPKADQLVRNFVGQWLAVRDFGSVQPAADYKNYDKSLEQASKQEPYAFFTEVLNKNLPITAFLDSDFVVVNERLAKHYGIAGVEGPEFRRVAIGPEHHRGGVLGMAGLMTYLADGTRTLPMRRGSWVLRELFNDPPNNPPPNAGEIQPNTAGKNLTVRERLELHRRDAICASCHAKLDPYGLALENYDAIGQWRERANGEGFRGPKAPLLDVSGVFPDGTKFATLEEYKAGLMAKKLKFARAFSTKLLTYALCRPVGYTDRKLVDSLTEELRRSDYRIQSLIYAIVASEPFNMK